MRKENVRYLFEPESVAIIGASAKPGKIGNSLLKNLKDYGFKGKIYPVNLKEKEILGVKTYKSILEVPSKVDLAIIAIPAKYVHMVLEECGRAGVKAVIVVSSGFGEIGNKREEKELAKVVKRYDMVMLGPNIFGIIYTPHNLNASFGPLEILKGRIAFATQSGALGVALMGKTIEKRIGMSAIVGLGNKADLTDTDILEFLSQDENTKVIIFYIEALKDGRAFLSQVSRVVQKKPVIVLKAGRTEKGATAAASHTGSLAGDDSIYSAAFKQHGVLRALSYQQAFDWAGALATQKLPEGENVVIITNGGGVGVMAADSSEDYGLKLLNDYPLLDETFKPYIPPFGSARNPIDITGQATDETLITTLKAALERREIHALVVIYTESATSDFKKLSKEIIELSKKTHEKPVIFCFVGSEKCQLAIDLLNEAGLAAYSEPERAISALSILFEHKRFLEREKTSGDFELKIDFENIKRIIKRVRDDSRLQLLENESKEILRMAGFEVPKFGVGRSIRECRKLASEIGFPVVMKIVSEDILHKSDVGGVKIGIDSLSDVEKAYKEIVRGVKGKYPDAKIRGIMVCEMVSEGLEIILGLSRDPTFGPVLMFGLGGIYVEILGDVTFRIAPLSLKDAKEMVHEIKTSPLLYGARGQKRADIEKLTENIYRLSKLVLNLKDLVEMDINPLMVLEKGKGCKVLDARMTLKPT